MSDTSPPLQIVFPPIEGEEEVVISRVIDGDSIKFNWLVNDTARLWGINAPEVHGATREAGLAATAYLKQLLYEAGAQVRVRIHGRDKYGRALLELFDQYGRSINQRMIDAGHAVPYLP